MILRCFLSSIFLCLVFEPAVKAQVTVDDKEYQNLLISIEPNVDFSKGKETLKNIQQLIRITSSVLYKAIGIRIASATFLLPPSWPTDQWKDITVTQATPAELARKVDIIATKESPFGQQPVALQYGGCGVPGHQITLPLDFFLNFDIYPKGKLLAREWLKYRYGVFDENGYPDDKMYPDIYKIPWSSDIRFTECTNSKVTYHLKNPNNNNACEMGASSNYNKCRARPDDKSAINVTSSLMYFHRDLLNMEYICGKDGRPHNSLARNKQNALCNGRSIWDVVKTSDDFKNSRRQSVAPDTGSIKFSYIQEGKPRFVVLLENSDKLFEQKSAVQFALRRLYYDLPSDSKFALYTYNSDVEEVVPYTELPSHSREDLAVIADFGSPAKSVCTSCALARAAQTLLEKSEVDKGSIFLITASPLDTIPGLSEKLKASGICLHVLRFTNENNPVDNSYDALAKSFYCFSQESLPMGSDVVDIFNYLFRFLKNPVPKFDNGPVSRTVASGNMSSQIPVTIPRDESALQYTLWLGRALGKDSIECRADDTLVALKPDIAATDIASFTFDPPDNDVTCMLGSAKQSPLLTQVEMKTEQDFVFDVWIHDLSTEKEQRPITIHAKLYYGGYPIKSANVTTVVKSLKNPEEVVSLFDNGRGNPDVTKDDGIYSGYFANFLEAGFFQLTVKINDGERQAQTGEEDSSSRPVFEMEKHIVYQAKGKRPKGGYKPSKIVDLIAMGGINKVRFICAAPGAGKAARYAIKVFISREDAVTKFDTTGQELEISKNGSIKPRVSVTGTWLVFEIPLDPFEEGVVNYLAIRSWNEFNKPSEVSNVVEFMKPKPDEETTEKEDETSTDIGITKDDPPDNGNKTVGIVLGVFGGFVVLIALGLIGHYYFVKKPRRN